MHRSHPPAPASILLITPSDALGRQWHDVLLSGYGATVALGIMPSLLEGMSHLGRHRPDVVLLDLVFSHSSALITRLRLTAPGCALVAWTAVQDDAVLLEALGAGAHEVLTFSSAAPCDWRSTVERALVRAGTGAASAQPALDPDASQVTRVIHDLNNVLTSINGYADILLARPPSSDQAHHCAEQIRQAGRQVRGQRGWSNPCQRPP